MIAWPAVAPTKSAVMVSVAVTPLQRAVGAEGQRTRCRSAVDARGPAGQLAARGKRVVVPLLAAVLRK